MATFTSRAIVDRLIAGGGWETPDDHDAPDNPQVIRIVEYTTPEGQVCWGVVFAGDRDPHRYEVPSQWVRYPRVIYPEAAMGR